MKNIKRPHQTFNFKHISKNKIIVYDYCSHGDIETTTKIFTHIDKINICPICANEIINSNSCDYNENECSHILDILKTPNKKVHKNLFMIWYPNLYNAINTINANTWGQKLYMFINNIRNEPLCECGKKIKVNVKSNKFNSRCEHCTRSTAMSKSNNDKSIKMWTTILKEKFNISNPNFKIIDKYNIQININNVSLTLRKSLIKSLSKHGILSHTLISENDFKIEYWKHEFLKNFNKYKLLSEEILKNSYPGIYKMLEILNRDVKISNISELKIYVKNGCTRPTCSLCDNYASFNDSNLKYNTNCEKHKYKVFSSKGEIELGKFIESIYPGKILNNFKDTKIGEIDIYLPELKLGIEFNGLFWHNDDHLNKDYHFKKWDAGEKQDIQLITIWEDDWRDKNEIIKSIISTKLNRNKCIYARNCIIKLINYNIAKGFLVKNHLQGACPAHINIGLLYNDELVSLMTFGKKRIILNSKSESENDYELLRFCNKLNTTIVGGASKLFKYFLKIHTPKNITSYASCDTFNGNMYASLGFRQITHTGLNYWWCKNGIRYHRSNFMKYKLIKEGYDKSQTEDEIMRKRNYTKIWGTGNLKFIYENF